MSNEKEEPERLQETADEQQPGTVSIEDPSEEEITAVAHDLWVARGCPIGTAEEDWFRALEEIRNRRAKSAVAG